MLFWVNTYNLHYMFSLYVLYANILTNAFVDKGKNLQTTQSNSYQLRKNMVYENLKV